MKNTYNMNKKTLLLLLLAVAGLAKAQQWHELQSGVTDDLYSVCCIDTNTVLVCGANGVILKTNDGGNNWQEKYRQEGYEWYKIKFLDSNIGFVFGDDDNSHDNNYKLLKTNDGGETWLDMGSPFNEHNYTTPFTCDLFIVDADTLYVACDRLMKSTDGGYTFSQLDIEWINTTQDLYFEGNVGYIVWGEPNSIIGTHIAKTTDYGSSWEEIQIFDCFESFTGLEQAFFHDKDHVVLYGGFDGDDNNAEYNVIRTENGFATYQCQLIETIPTGWWDYPTISGLSFSDIQHGIIIYLRNGINSGSSIHTFQTQDEGNTWHELGSIDCANSESAGLSGREGTYYLVCGESVYRMKMTLDGVSEEKEMVFAFPNPVSNTLFFYGQENSDLILYDLLGRMLLQQEISDRIQKIEIGSFPSGIYLLSIKNNKGNISFQKIVKK